MLSKKMGIVEWMDFSKQRIFIAVVCALTLVQTSWVSAQSGLGAIPEITVMDLNGVDLLSHQPIIQATDISIGDSSMGLEHSLKMPAWGSSVVFDKFSLHHGRWNGRPEVTDTVTFGGNEINFNGGLPLSQNGETLVDLGNGLMLLTQRDGTKITTNKDGTNSPSFGKIESPVGLITQIYYKAMTGGSRIQSVVQNNGLQLKYNYNAAGVLSSIVALNNTVDYCDPIADSCTYTKTWPTVTYTTTVPLITSYPCQYCAPVYTPSTNSYTFTVTHPGSVTDYVYLDRISEIRKSGSPPITYTWLKADNFRDDGSVVFAPPSIYGYFIWRVKKGNATWNYTWSFSADGLYKSGGVNGPTGNTSVNSNRGLPVNISAQDSTVYFPGVAPNRISAVATPAGATKSFAFDYRGNLTSTSIAGLVEAAVYDDCSNPVRCNKPTSVTDARGGVTNYDYYSTAPLGFLKSVTKPAGINGFRPQTRYEYTQRSAWLKNASGSFVAGSPIWLISKESSCITGNSCAVDSNEEVVTTYDYGPNSGPNNLFLRGIVKTAFDGGSRKSLRTCYGYDIYGHKISETAPKAGLTSCP